MIEILDGPSTWERMSKLALQSLKVQIGVAYITTEQLDRLLPALKKVAARKGAGVEILCGIGNMSAQSPEALQKLDEFAQRNPKKVSFGVVARSRTLFHPKYYYFADDRRADIFIGSSNLTSPAFKENTGCNIHLSLDVNDILAQECRGAFAGWINLAKEGTASIKVYAGF